jgi:hypothetical protein
MIMCGMRQIEHLGLDGHALNALLMVLEESSVSRAAERLGVSQSAASHTLDKLRGIFDDALFVRVGRGIEPTARARAGVGAAIDRRSPLSLPKTPSAPLKAHSRAL